MLVLLACSFVLAILKSSASHAGAFAVLILRSSAEICRQFFLLFCFPLVDVLQSSSGKIVWFYDVVAGQNGEQALFGPVFGCELVGLVLLAPAD